MVQILVWEVTTYGVYGMAVEGRDPDDYRCIRCRYGIQAFRADGYLDFAVGSTRINNGILTTR